MKFTIKPKRKLTSDEVLEELGKYSEGASARKLSKRLEIELRRMMIFLGKMVDAGLIRSEFHRVDDGKGYLSQESIYTIKEEQ